MEEWESGLLGAYAVFGVDPLDRAGEFGFRFPKLSVAFLREKAKDQLRDALGRWRKMRGTLDGDDDGTPVERASLKKVAGTGSLIDEAVDKLTLKDIEKMKSSTRKSERERLIMKVITSRYEKANGKPSVDEPFTVPDETDPESMKAYVDRLKYLKARGTLRRKYNEPEYASDDYWSGSWDNASHQYEIGNNPDGRPSTEGAPDDRLALLPQEQVPEPEPGPELTEYEQALQGQAEWDFAHMTVPRSTYDILLAQGHNDPPTIVPMDEFDAIEGYEIPGFYHGEYIDELGFTPENGTVLFRGKSGSKSISSIDAMASLQYAPSDETYVPFGMYGNGLYFGNLESSARYAVNDSITDKGKQMIEEMNSNGNLNVKSLMQEKNSIIVGKLRKDAVVMDIKEYTKAGREVLKRIKQDQTLTEEEKIELARRYGIEDYTGPGWPTSHERFAAMHGVDAMIVSVGRDPIRKDEQNILIFNRSALIMPDYGLTYTPLPPRPVLPPKPE